MLAACQSERQFQVPDRDGPPRRTPSNIRLIRVIRGRLLPLNSCLFVVKTKVRFGERGGDGSQSRGSPKQKRPAEAGRFE
jgi:hypothetical protein